MISVAQILVLAVLMQTTTALVCYHGRRYKYSYWTANPLTSRWRGDVCEHDEVCSTVYYPGTGFFAVEEYHTQCMNPDDGFNCTVDGGRLRPTGCATKYCNTDACNEFDADKQWSCKNSTPTDFRLTSGCTAIKVAEFFESCARQWLDGYPYSDVNDCRTNLDYGVSCLDEKLRRCTGSCYTDFDIVGNNAFDFSETFKNYTSAGTISSLLSVWGFPLDKQSDIIDAVCLQENTLFAQRLVPLLRIYQFSLSFGRICSRDAVQEVIDRHAQALPQLLNGDHGTQCKYNYELQQMTIERWTSGCNVSALVDMLISYFPPGYGFLTSKVESVVKYIEGRLKGYALPGCEEEWRKNSLANILEHLQGQSDNSASSGSDGDVNLNNTNSDFNSNIFNLFRSLLPNSSDEIQHKKWMLFLTLLVAVSTTAVIL